MDASRRATRHTDSGTPRELQSSLELPARQDMKSASAEKKTKKRDEDEEEDEDMTSAHMTSAHVTTQDVTQDMIHEGIADGTRKAKSAEKKKKKKKGDEDEEEDGEDVTSPRVTSLHQSSWYGSRKARKRGLVDDGDNDGDKNGDENGDENADEKRDENGEQDQEEDDADAASPRKSMKKEGKKLITHAKFAEDEQECLEKKKRQKAGRLLRDKDVVNYVDSHERSLKDDKKAKQKLSRGFTSAYHEMCAARASMAASMAAKARIPRPRGRPPKGKNGLSMTWDGHMYIETDGEKGEDEKDQDGEEDEDEKGEHSDKNDDEETETLDELILGRADALTDQKKARTSVKFALKKLQRCTDVVHKYSEKIIARLRQ